MENTTKRRGPVSKYINDPTLLQQVELICAQQTTKDEAAAALGFKSAAVLNNVLKRVGYSDRIREATPRNTDHLFKNSLTPEQKSVVQAAVSLAVGLTKGSPKTKKDVWEQDALQLVSYTGFCAMVKKAEEAQQ